MPPLDPPKPFQPRAGISPLRGRGRTRRPRASRPPRDPTASTGSRRSGCTVRLLTFEQRAAAAPQHRMSHKAAQPLQWQDRLACAVCARGSAIAILQPRSRLDAHTGHSRRCRCSQRWRLSTWLTQLRAGDTRPARIKTQSHCMASDCTGRSRAAAAAPA